LPGLTPWRIAGVAVRVRAGRRVGQVLEVAGARRGIAGERGLTFVRARRAGVDDVRLDAGAGLAARRPAGIVVRVRTGRRVRHVAGDAGARGLIADARRAVRPRTHRAERQVARLEATRHEQPVVAGRIRARVARHLLDDRRIGIVADRQHLELERQRAEAAW